MNNYLVIVATIKPKKDVKEYTIKAMDKYLAELEAESMYRIESHYVKSMPNIDDVWFDLIQIN